MPIYHCEFEQRSAAWYQIRLGMPTASEMDRIVTPAGKPSKQAEAYMHRLLAEWLLGEPIENDLDTQWMEHGRDNEDAAVKSFEFQTGLETETVGFVTTDDALAGCSPDRLVSDLGTLEIKCPKPNTHVGYMLATSVAEDYRVQNQAQTWICEREKSWVSSYHPKLPPIILEIPRDDKFIGLLSGAVRGFVDLMLEKRVQLERRFGPFERPQKADRKPDPDFDRFGITDADLEEYLESKGVK